MSLLAEWMAASPARATTTTRITKRIEVTWSASSLLATIRQPRTSRAGFPSAFSVASGAGVPVALWSTVGRGGSSVVTVAPVAPHEVPVVDGVQVGAPAAEVDRGVPCVEQGVHHRRTD